MTTDRILGSAKGPWAWVLCFTLLGIAIGSGVEYVRWGGGVYLIGAPVLAGVALAGIVRLVRTRRVKTDV